MLADDGLGGRGAAQDQRRADQRRRDETRIEELRRRVRQPCVYRSIFASSRGSHICDRRSGAPDWPRRRVQYFTPSSAVLLVIVWLIGRAEGAQLQLHEPCLIARQRGVAVVLIDRRVIDREGGAIVRISRAEAKRGDRERPRIGVADLRRQDRTDGSCRR